MEQQINAEKLVAVLTEKIAQLELENAKLRVLLDSQSQKGAKP